MECHLCFVQTDKTCPTCQRPTCDKCIVPDPIPDKNVCVPCYRAPKFSEQWEAIASDCRDEARHPRKSKLRRSVRELIASRLEGLGPGQLTEGDRKVAYGNDPTVKRVR